MAIKTLVFIFACFHLARCFEFFNKACEEYTITSPKDFNVTRYLGKWFEIKRYDNPFEPYGDCVTAKYTFSTDKIEVRNYQKDLRTGNKSIIIGSARAANGDGRDGKLLVKFPVAPVESNYWVLGSDYDNYSVVWSCRTLNPNNSSQILWILARGRTLTDPAKTTVDSIINNNGLDSSRFRTTVQDPQTCGCNKIFISKFLIMLLVINALSNQYDKH